MFEILSAIISIYGHVMISCNNTLDDVNIFAQKLLAFWFRIVLWVSSDPAPFLFLYLDIDVEEMRKITGILDWV